LCYLKKRTQLDARQCQRGWKRGKGSLKENLKKETKKSVLTYRSATGEESFLGWEGGEWSGGRGQADP